MLENMQIYASYKQSASLLTAKDMRHLRLAMLAQMAASLFDLFGVLLIGLISLVATTSLQSKTLPPTVEKYLSLVGMENSQPGRVLTIMGILAIVLFLSKSIIVPLMLRKVLRFLTRRSADVSFALARAYFSQPFMEAQSDSSQKISYALGVGVSAAIGETLGASVIIVAESSLLIFLSLTLILIDPQITFFTVLYFATTAFLLQKFLGNWVKRTGKIRQVNDIKGMASIQELMQSYREVFVGNHKKFYLDRFAGIRHTSAAAQADAQLINYIPKYSLEGSLVLGGGILTALEFTTRSPATAASTLVLFLTASSRVLPSILRLQSAATTIRNASGYSIPTFEIVNNSKLTDYQTQLSEDEGTALRIQKEGTGFKPIIEVNDVTFSYDKQTAATLSNVSLTITPGSFIAIAGPTGSGKSTLIDLILGINSPDSGGISISDQSPSVSVIAWPGAIGFVPQSVALANASVRENVALGIPRALIDDDQVWESLEKAKLATYLRSAREGLDTQIGESGLKLSGGQRQRLGLARALYTNPQLLVLDEATSALDAETEAAISQAIYDLGSNVTRITIAHRLATVMRADQVLYLENGHILASGTFEEVRNQVPQFDTQAKLLGL